MSSDLILLNDRIPRCIACPRLAQHRERVARERKPQFAGWSYWGKPVPGFGDPRARLLIVGLAPAAHGANRTGRMFTGDPSGDFLYDTLARYEFGNQAASTARDDGLVLTGAYITAAGRCAPPQNKPTKQELDNCRPYLVEEMAALSNLRVVVALERPTTSPTAMANATPTAPPATSTPRGIFRLDLVRAIEAIIAKATVATKPR